MQQANLSKSVAHIIVFYAFHSLVVFLITLEDTLINKVHAISVLSFLAHLLLGLKLFLSHFLNQLSYLSFCEILKQEAVHAEKKYAHISVLLLFFSSFNFYRATRGFFRAEAISSLSRFLQPLLLPFAEFEVTDHLEVAALV